LNRRRSPLHYTPRAQHRHLAVAAPPPWLTTDAPPSRPSVRSPLYRRARAHPTASRCPQRLFPPKLHRAPPPDASLRGRLPPTVLAGPLLHRRLYITPVCTPRAAELLSAFDARTQRVCASSSWPLMPPLRRLSGWRQSSVWRSGGVAWLRGGRRRIWYSRGGPPVGSAPASSVRGQGLRPRCSRTSPARFQH
jgi:hypothetical protein